MKTKEPNTAAQLCQAREGRNALFTFPRNEDAEVG